MNTEGSLESMLKAGGHEVPRIRHYCFAGSTSYALEANIPEIKNYDGMCKDYLPGARPSVNCRGCTHLSKPYNTRPSASRVDVGSYCSAMRYADSEMTRSLFDSMSREVARTEQMGEMEEKEYEQELSNDVMTTVYDNRPPSNGTIENCKASVFRACAVENRSNHCPRFSALAPLETIAGETRWRELTIQNKDYRETVSRCISAETAERARYEIEEGYEQIPERPPCFSCVHRRAPVSNDLFKEIHFNSPEIMNLRDGYRREKKQREAEERLVSTQPGKALGSDFPPHKQVWCDKYSTHTLDGKINEYAYCLRVLKSTGGNCPSYEESRQDRNRVATAGAAARAQVAEQRQASKSRSVLAAGAGFEASLATIGQTVRDRARAEMLAQQNDFRDPARQVFVLELL